METTLPTPTRRITARSAAFWLTTGLLAFGMTAGGLGQLLHAQFNVDGMRHLGYPTYLLYILGAWKLVGVAALLLPGRPLLKEWAHAGFFFLLTGGVLSHVLAGDGFAQTVWVAVFAGLNVASWYLRPASRRLPATER